MLVVFLGVRIQLNLQHISHFFSLKPFFHKCLKSETLRLPPCFVGLDEPETLGGLYRPLGRYSGLYFTNRSQYLIVITLFFMTKTNFELSLKTNTCGWRRIYLSISDYDTIISVN